LNLSSFFTSRIKENLANAKQALSPPQKKGQPPSAEKNSSTDKPLDLKRAVSRAPVEKAAAEEKEGFQASKYTYMHNFKGGTTPLLFRTSNKGSEKERREKKTPEQTGIEFLLETENLGPVILRMEVVDGVYYSTIFLHSEEAKELLIENKAEIVPIWEDLLKEAGLTYHKLIWKILSPEEKERLWHEKKRDFLDQRV
jgi:hypothetical protein